MILGLMAFAPRHDFHNSLTEMRFNAKTRTFEVEIKLFTDDLEAALSFHNAQKKFKITDNDTNDKPIEAYVRKHFKLLNTKGKPYDYSYVGKQNELDATWIFVEIPFRDPPKGCRVQQSALTDMFPDQQNILNFNFGPEKQYFLLNEKKITQEIP